MTILRHKQDSVNLSQCFVVSVLCCLLLIKQTSAHNSAFQREKITCTESGCDGPCKNFENQYREGFWRDFSFASYECPTLKFLAIVDQNYLDDYAHLKSNAVKLSNENFQASSSPNMHDVAVNSGDEIYSLHGVSKEINDMLIEIDLFQSTVKTEIHDLISKCPHTAIKIDWLGPRTEIVDCSELLDFVSSHIRDLVTKIKSLSSIIDASLMSKYIERRNRIRNLEEIHQQEQHQHQRQNLDEIQEVHDT